MDDTPGNQHRVLVIDDDAVDAEIFRRAARQSQRLAITVEHATTLASGIQTASTGPFDALFLDLNLAECQGLETLDKLIEADLGVPVVVLTGMDASLGQAAVAQGADDYLCKENLSTELLEKTIIYARERATRVRLMEARKDELVSLIAKEQMKIADDLHDGAMQLLTTVQRRVQSLHDQLSGKNRSLAGEISALCSQTHQALKAAIKGIPPAELSKLGLPGALSKLAQQVHVDKQTICHFQAEPTITIARPNLSLQLYYIAQQALQNAIQHAAASEIQVRLMRNDSSVVLQVADNGRGFDPSVLQRSAAGWGLRSMRNRAMAIGARLTIRSAPGRGTTIQCGIAERKLSA